LRSSDHNYIYESNATQNGKKNIAGQDFDRITGLTDKGDPGIQRGFSLKAL
jgi:hypothetical protein